MRTALLLGTLAGLALGLLYAWIISPVEFRTASPAQVEAPYREVWIVMAAEAYLANADWDRAQLRLNALADPNLRETIRALFERVNTAEPNPQARALAYLAEQAGATPVAGMAVYLTTPFVTPTPRATSLPVVLPSPTLEPTATDTFPSLTPSPTPTPEFTVVSNESVCDAGTPQIRVTVQNLDGGGLPGVDVWITWDGGADRFVTGLKPELGSGFGDFDMQPDVSYRVGAGSQSALALVTNLRANACITDAGEDGRLSWNVTLRPITP